jgi:hypothetical protein
MQNLGFIKDVLKTEIFCKFFLKKYFLAAENFLFFSSILRFKKFFINFFAPNLVNYFWCHRASMKNDITTTKAISNQKDTLQ